MVVHRAEHRWCDIQGLSAHQRTLHESWQQRRRLWLVLQPPQGCHGGADLLDGRARQQLLDACRQQRQKLGRPSGQDPKTPQGACNRSGSPSESLLSIDVLSC